MITIVPGDTVRLVVETQRDGLGVEVPSQVLTADDSLKAYAVLRDVRNNYIGVISSVWSVSGGIGQVIDPSDSVVLRLTTVGSGRLTAAGGGFTGNTGVITVVAGNLASVKLRTDTLNGGIEAGDVTLSVGDSIKLYTAGYDADGNFKGNVAARYGTTGTLQASRLFITGDSTAVWFKPTTASVGRITDTSNVGDYTDSTGVITVTNTAAIARVRINSRANDAGVEVGAMVLSADEDTVMYLGGYDAYDNYIGDVVGVWTVRGTIDSNDLGPREGSATRYSPRVAGRTGKIIARYGSYEDSTEVVTTTAGAVAFLQIQSALSLIHI